MTPPTPFIPDDPTLHGALRSLPMPSAPATLAPRVMAAVAARLARHGIVTWFDWPIWARAASAAAALVAVVLVLWGAPEVSRQISVLSSGWTESLLQRLAPLVVVLEVAAPLINAWQALALWVVAGLTVFVLFAATCGALLDRLALGGASR